MRRTILLSVLLLMGTAAPGQEPDGAALADLERRLARTPPATTDFVEYRFSRLLKQPLRSAGTLEYRADGVMVRNVTDPYQEVTEVDGERVRIARAGKSTRTMSLQRAPQLRVLLGSFRALLEGRLVPLQQEFTVTLDEGATGWTLTLSPKDPGLAKHLARIDVHGSGDRPACLEALEPDGDGALTLFSAAPVAAKLPTRAELERNCRASSALRNAVP